MHESTQNVHNTFQMDRLYSPRTLFLSYLFHKLSVSTLTTSLVKYGSSSTPHSCQIHHFGLAGLPQTQYWTCSIHNARFQVLQTKCFQYLGWTFVPISKMFPESFRQTFWEASDSEISRKHSARLGKIEHLLGRTIGIVNWQI